MASRTAWALLPAITLAASTAPGCLNSVATGSGNCRNCTKAGAGETETPGS